MAMDREDPQLHIIANELEYDEHNDVSTGKIIKTIESSKDKGEAMEHLLKDLDKSRFCSVYVGDSALDLKALLLVDVGIVIGENEDLMKIMEHCKVDCGLLRDLSTAMNSSSLNQDSLKRKSPCLYYAEGWSEINKFLFEDNPEELRNVPKVLVIAGSDSGGGAGIQADLKTCMATGSFATTAVTAITSQNTYGVQAVHPIPLDHIQSQLDSILTGIVFVDKVSLSRDLDIGTDVIKTGMLPSVDVVKVVGAALERSKDKQLVLDPVMVSTSGHTLAGNQVAEAMIEHLFPICTVVCPNIPETEILSNQSITNLKDMREAAARIHALGPQIVLIKGGHLQNESSTSVVDVVFDGVDISEIKNPRIQTNRLHGTGCTLASAIASYLAQGFSPKAAIYYAIDFVRGALENSVSMKLGNGMQLPFNHGYLLHQWSSSKAKSLDLSLYGITDAQCNAKHQRSLSEAVKQAIEGGVSILQVREKHASSLEFFQAVETVLKIAKPYNVPVLVNDRVDIALAADADGVHLGQEDLPVERVRQMIGQNKILGVSTKTTELAIKAEQAGADYLGVGAIYSTTSKNSSVIGLEGLQKVTEAVKIPVVAIGGISESNAVEVLKTGVGGIALISGLFDQSDITSATKNFKNLIKSVKSVQSSSVGVSL